MNKTVPDQKKEIEKIKKTQTERKLKIKKKCKHSNRSKEACFTKKYKRWKLES